MKPTATTARTRAARLAAAAEPAPSTCERGPLAAIHYPAALDTSPALADVVCDTSLPAETAAVLAEAHASLFDPHGLRPLRHPSPVGRAVLDQLRATPDWQRLAEAAAAVPSIARDAVAALAPTLRSAMAHVGRDVDGRRAADRLAGATADLARARRRLDDARAEAAERLAEAKAAEAAADATAADASASDAALDAAEDAAAAARAEAGEAAAAEAAAERAEGEAAAEVGRAEGEAAAADAAGKAAAAGLDAGALGRHVARLADGAATQRATRDAVAAGLGDAVGASCAGEVPDDVVEALRATRDLAAVLRLVGAIRSAARRRNRTASRASGPTGARGVTLGGLAEAARATGTTRAALAGLLGDERAAATRYALATGRAAVYDRGDGEADRGDVVVLVDQSDSMDEGGRATWASALAVAVVLEARRAGRSAAVVAWSSAVRGTVEVRGPDDVAAALRCACMPPDGGTNVKAALAEARRVLDGWPRRGAGADVLLVTDGDWRPGALADWPRRSPSAPQLRVVTIAGRLPPDVAATGVVASHWDVGVVAGAEGEAAAVRIARACL